MKPVGKPDAGNRHVRFDERGWETGRRSASVLAPNLDSTQPGVEKSLDAARKSAYATRLLTECFADDVAHALVRAASRLFSTQGRPSRLPMPSRVEVGREY